MPTPLRPTIGLLIPTVALLCALAPIAACDDDDDGVLGGSSSDSATADTSGSDATGDGVADSSSDAGGGDVPVMGDTADTGNPGDSGGDDMSNRPVGDLGFATAPRG